MSKDFNFQNIPARDPEYAKRVRQAFIPRKGHRWIDADFRSLEVCIGCLYHQDLNMIAYLKDPTKDMHRDTAAKIYSLPEKEITKDIRFSAKGDMVFASFYGSYYAQTAPRLWDDAADLVTKSGISLHDWLKEKGITRLGDCDPRQKPRHGTFEKHIQDVERWLWEDRFPVYAAWKKSFYQKFIRNGYIKSLTGFVEHGYSGKRGILTRNDVANHVIQGTAFHCLLWTMIQTQRKLDQKEMKTLLVGQIHDSLSGDVPEEETQRYIKLVNRVVQVDLPKHWPWICVPLKVEIECTPVNKGNGVSWYDKKPWIERDGVWGPEKE